jgi:hypothetical protein
LEVSIVGGERLSPEHSHFLYETFPSSVVEILGWRPELHVEFDRFIMQYEMAFGPNAERTLPRAVQYFRQVIRPQLDVARVMLGPDSNEARKTIHEISEMLLRLLSDAPIGSEGRENLLFEIGRHFVEELKAEGLLTTSVHEHMARPFREVQPLPLASYQLAA